MGFMINFHKRQFNLKIEADQIAYMRLIVEEIAQLKSALDRDRYVREIAKMFDLSPGAILEDVDQIRKNKAQLGIMWV